MFKFSLNKPYKECVLEFDMTRHTSNSSYHHIILLVLSQERVRERESKKGRETKEKNGHRKTWREAVREKVRDPEHAISVCAIRIFFINILFTLTNNI